MFIFIYTFYFFCSVVSVVSHEHNYAAAASIPSNNQVVQSNQCGTQTSYLPMELPVEEVKG